MIINPTHLLHSAKKLNNGSAPGPSGWTIPHVLWLLQDAALATPFAALLAYIGRGLLSGNAKRRLLTSRLMAISKKQFVQSDLSSSSECPDPNRIRPSLSVRFSTDSSLIIFYIRVVISLFAFRRFSSAFTGLVLIAWSTKHAPPLNFILTRF